MAKAVSQITITDLNDPIISGTAPANPKAGQLWLNTSVTPGELLSFENGAWKTVRSQPKPDSVGQPEIKESAVTRTKIADNAISSTKITGGAITTPKLAANAVTADKIAAGAITAQKILAGVITADKLDVLAKSLVNNYSVTGKNKGWTPNITLSRASELGNSYYHIVSGTSASVYRSEAFEINPTVTYKVGISLRSPFSGSKHFGFECYDSLGNRLKVKPIYTSNKNEGTETTSPYFKSWYSVQNDWMDVESYILGCNSTPKSLPETKNATLAFKLPKGAHHLRLLYSFYPTSGQSQQSYWWSPFIVSTDAGEIQADRITNG